MFFRKQWLFTCYKQSWGSPNVVAKKKERLVSLIMPRTAKSILWIIHTGKCHSTQNWIGLCACFPFKTWFVLRGWKSYMHIIRLMLTWQQNLSVIWSWESTQINDNGSHSSFLCVWHYVGILAKSFLL